MSPHVRPWPVVQSALEAWAGGVDEASNAAAHGVAVKTLRRWCVMYARDGQPRGQTHLAAPCPRCTDGPLDEAAYCELLGWYLGDGYISTARRGVYGLHVVNDRRYPRDLDRIAELMKRVKPQARPHTREVPGAIIVTVSWKHWPCVFPQHGPGRKHTRSMRLEDWQERLVAAHPAPLLRGLFHSDGTRVINTVTKQTSTGPRRYHYARWQFVNHSDDIRGICTDALDRVGVAWRRNRWNCISVSRREAVDRLDSLIGLKA